MSARQGVQGERYGLPWHAAVGLVAAPGGLVLCDAAPVGRRREAAERGAAARHASRVGAPRTTSGQRASPGVPCDLGRTPTHTVAWTASYYSSAEKTKNHTEVSNSSCHVLPPPRPCSHGLWTCHSPQCACHHVPLTSPWAYVSLCSCRRGNYDETSLRDVGLLL
jgi:hypothetical protein